MKVIGLNASPNLDGLTATMLAAALEGAAEAGADVVELHTGPYANAREAGARRQALDSLAAAEALCRELGLGMNAGHGLTYDNIGGLLEVLHPVELHIGHSIVARAVLVGIERAVREMKALIMGAARR